MIFFGNRLGRLAERPLFHIALIAVLGLLIYSNTSHAPFFLSVGYVKENPFVRDIHFPLEQLKQSNMDYYMLSMNRYIPYLTFALNYRLHGFEEFGYHVVNIAFHLLNGLLVYALVATTFRTPVLAPSVLHEKRYLLAFFVALLFVLHPIQTETVNWIWHGRNGVLTAFFYLAALVGYMSARLEEDRVWKKKILYVVAFLSAVAAMKCKEIAVTLPVMIALCEFAFFSGDAKKRIIRLIPFGLTILIVPLTYLLLMGFSFDEATQGFVPATSQPVSRWDYMMTQLRVLTDYLRLFVLPVNMPVFRPWTTSTSLLDRAVLLSGAVLSVLLSAGSYFLIRFRRIRPEMSVIGFGIVWFFLAHAVESGFIPLSVLTALYRNYLPSIGLFLAMITAAYLFFLKISWRDVRMFSACICAVLLVLSVLTYRRNEIWKTPFSLAKDVVDNAPESAQAHFILGRAYKHDGRMEEAKREFDIAFRLDEAASAGPVTAGSSVEAGEIGGHGRETTHGDARSGFEAAEAYYNNRQFDDALREMQAVLKLDPGHAGAHYYTAVIFHERGMLEEAAGEYRLAIKAKQDFVEARSDYAGLLAQMGKLQEAISELRAALQSRPDYAPAHRFLGMIFQDMGRLTDAENSLRAAIQYKPDYAEAHNNLGEVYIQMGNYKDAAVEFRASIRLKPDYDLPKQNLKKIQGG